MKEKQEIIAIYVREGKVDSRDQSRNQLHRKKSRDVNEDEQRTAQAKKIDMYGHLADQGVNIKVVLFVVLRVA